MQHPSEVEKSHSSHSHSNGNLKTGKLNSSGLDQAPHLWTQRKFLVKWAGKTSYPKPWANAQAHPVSGKLLILALGSNTCTFLLQPIISTTNTMTSPGRH